MAKIIRSRFPESDQDYEKQGLMKDHVELWEDGMRTTGKKGDYEWWYFDSSYPDGTKLVIVFYTKNPVKAVGPASPLVTMELTMADGRKYYDQITPPSKEAYYSREKCLVVIGNSSIEGDLTNYQIIFNGPKMSARVSLRGTLPPWRPHLGQIYFGDKDEHSFNWLPSVPEGDVTADITYPDGQLHLNGTGYHDHNWGDISMFKLMHHWYWGRAKIGDYKVISSWITAGEPYGFNEFDIFLLAKGNEVLGDNRNHTLKFLPENEYIDSNTGKPVYGKVIYEYETPKGEYYRITFDRRNDIAREFFYESLPKALRPAAIRFGFLGSYQRFEGTAMVERIENSETVEKAVEESAVWELMYFGEAGADKDGLVYYGEAEPNREDQDD